MRVDGGGFIKAYLCRSSQAHDTRDLWRRDYIALVGLRAVSYARADPSAPAVSPCEVRSPPPWRRGVGAP